MGLREDGKMMNILFNKEMYEKLKADAENRGMSFGAFVKSIIYDWYDMKED